jgi:hypothetical protein
MVCASLNGWEFMELSGYEPTSVDNFFHTLVREIESWKDETNCGLRSSEELSKVEIQLNRRFCQR